MEIKMKKLLIILFISATVYAGPDECKVTCETYGNTDSWIYQGVITTVLNEP